MEKMAKLTTSKRLDFSRSDQKAIIAGLEFILDNAAKHDVDANVLQEELMQLGLPQDTSLAICKGYKEKKDEMRKHFLTKSLALSKVKSCDWRVDYNISTKDLRTLNRPSIRLCLRLDSMKDGEKTLAFEMPVNKFRTLMDELKTALELMKDV
eukprot:CAMPEP_0114523530 /NCGR_PEP_ID=MMETSP0109-20121206/21340_1 /TAXON_ID=29199 /ORGANISM="Chlorarachnion reptans, Strain CCCM449" /LENGTH=152 /DNA_ID=CAMNT_0001704851 /DNA_START=162 /DNA_END=620 /DNA_ORIENTATION=-